MLLHMTNPLVCEILPHRITLSRGDKMISHADRLSEEPMEIALQKLLQPCCGTLPWFHQVEFVLDASLVNHLVIPWQAGIGTPDELRNYSIILAQKNFPQLAGKQLRVGFEDMSFGHNALAFVIEETLWQSLYQVAHKLRLRPAGISTPLQSLLCSWRETLPAEGIFALTGEQESTFACRSDGEWKHIYRIALHDLDERQQLTLIARLSGMNRATCHLWHREQGRVTVS